MKCYYISADVRVLAQYAFIRSRGVAWSSRRLLFLFVNRVGYFVSCSVDVVRQFVSTFQQSNEKYEPLRKLNEKVGHMPTPPSFEKWGAGCNLRVCKTVSQPTPFDGDVQAAAQSELSRDSIHLLSGKINRVEALRPGILSRLW